MENRHSLEHTWNRTNTSKMNPQASWRLFLRDIKNERNLFPFLQPRLIKINGKIKKPSLIKATLWCSHLPPVVVCPYPKVQETIGRAARKMAFPFEAYLYRPHPQSKPIFFHHCPCQVWILQDIFSCRTFLFLLPICRVYSILGTLRRTSLFLKCQNVLCQNRLYCTTDIHNVIHLISAPCII